MEKVQLNCFRVIHKNLKYLWVIKVNGKMVNLMDLERILMKKTLNILVTLSQAKRQEVQLSFLNKGFSIKEKY